MRRLLIATNNPGKVEEFHELLGDCGWELVTPSELGLQLEVEENGTTYAENARIKAEAFSRASGLPSLADDSGLEVDALSGQPGALHHLNGWDGVDQADRIAILLRALKDVPPEKRSGRFRAVTLVALPDGTVLQEEGACEGVVIDTARGEGGFGYDPVFFLPSLGKTMSELTRAEKNAISHRGIAAAKIRQRLRELV